MTIATDCYWSISLTGSNNGIGKATALGLAKKGARVILACRNQIKAEAAAFDIRRVGPTMTESRCGFD